MGQHKYTHIPAKGTWDPGCEVSSPERAEMSLVLLILTLTVLPSSFPIFPQKRASSMLWMWLAHAGTQECHWSQTTSWRVSVFPDPGAALKSHAAHSTSQRGQKVILSRAFAINVPCTNRCFLYCSTVCLDWLHGCGKHQWSRDSHICWSSLMYK